jgi:CMP-N-acetylneuraminic acid synthetase
MIVALLPMKANSERVKGKNFKMFGEKPLYRWILDTLISIDIIDHIVINTDARNILEEDKVFRENTKLIIRDRPEEICGDLVSMNEIISDDINFIEAELYLMTHTTNPFLSADSIEKSIEIFKNKSRNNKIDSLFTVNKIQERFYDKNSNPINHNPKVLSRTQDLEPWYKENSNLYLFTQKSFNSTNARIGKKPFMLETEDYESIDIDTPSDWDLAEILRKHYLSMGYIK